MQTVQEKFDLWCVVELFGHAKIAGRCTEQNIAGTNMLRVDVPETAVQPSFTRFFGSSAIYAINPVDEATAKYYAERLEQKPIESYDVKKLLAKNDQLRLAVIAGDNKEWTPVQGVDRDSDDETFENGHGL